MQYLIVAGCVLASFVGVLCNGGWNPWNQNNLWNQNQNNWGQGSWNHPNQQQGGGMQGNLLAQLLGHGMQGGNGMQGGQGNTGGMGQGSGMGQNNILGQIVQLMMLKPLLEGLGGKSGGDKGRQDDGEGDEMGKMYEGFMKGKMTQEFMDHILAYTELKDTEKEFGEAMKGLCGMVDGTYAWAKERKVEMFNTTDGAFMDDLEKKVEHMTEEEKYALLSTWLDNAHSNEDPTFHEVFFRMATWSCMTGHKFMEATMHMERLQKGEGQCDDKKDKD